MIGISYIRSTHSRDPKSLLVKLLITYAATSLLLSPTVSLPPFLPTSTNFLIPLLSHRILNPIPIHLVLLSTLDPRPFFPVGGRINVVGCNAGGFIFDFFGQDEVEDDGDEGGYCVGYR